MSGSRRNHYVPEWHQKGFFADGETQLRYLCLEPNRHNLPNGEVKVVYPKKWRPPSQCFYQTDLYTTFFGPFYNDEIERKLFGQIDNSGSHAVRAYIDGDARRMHDNFQNLFLYMDAQKIRTPKGLDYIQSNYPNLNQLELMIEMQAIRNLHCTLWSESVREIVSAENSEVKFIVSDHPVTIYNHACPPDSTYCSYPSDPDISLKGSQTIYPLDKEHLLILTNLEYAKNPDAANPLEQRTNPTKMRQGLTRTDTFIRTRTLNADDVIKINHIIKSRANKYIGAGVDEWLYPEKKVSSTWSELRNVLLPPSDQTFRFGGEIYVGYEDGTTYYQDAFGRTTPSSNEYLIKDTDEKNIGRNSPCGCGSGKKYKHCCKDVPVEHRTTWKLRSIRERNLILYNAIYDIFGLNKGKTWDDVQREISDEQISEIHTVYDVLWPLDTDIYSLLPKPDGKLRGVYSGLIDPRSINIFATNITLYFDELLIQNPFIHPRNVNPEFSPVESPHRYRYQSLKNIFFLLSIEPLVESGLINLFPDPCNFDRHLQKQVMDMATERRDMSNVSQRDKRLFQVLAIEDLLNATYWMPEQVKKRMIRTEFPHLKDEEIPDLIRALDARAKSDPLVLMNGTESEDGSQLMLSQMSPNYELALFIAQTTGSVIVTDSETRWLEIQAAQHRQNGIASYPWKLLSDSFSDAILKRDAGEVAMDFSKKHFSELRNTLRLMNKIVRSGIKETNQIRKLSLQLSNKFSAVIELEEDQQHPSARIKALMPEGGFTDNNVHRLLLKSNCRNYMPKVDMAMYLSTEE